MTAFFDMVKTGVVGNPGTGSISVGAALSGFQDWTSAAVPNFTTVPYFAGDQLTNGVYTIWEVGHGVFNAGVLTRSPVASSAGGGLVNLTASAVVAIVMLAGDFMPNPLLIASKTTDYNVLVTDSGTHFDNFNGSNLNFNLPASQPGLTYTFSVVISRTVSVVCAGVEQIAIGASNSVIGGKIAASVPFATVTIECHQAGQWIATSTTGSWTVT